MATAIPKTEIAVERRAAQRPMRVAVQENAPLQVVCHDLINLMSATLKELDNTGGILVSKDFSQEVPPFKRGGKVWLHLLNPETELSEKVEAKIVRFTRNDGHWEYKFTWVQHPLMLGGQAHSLAP
jgi:hypothetical protein